MPVSQIRILNFDDSVTSQKNLLASYEAEILDLRDTGPGARMWLDNKTQRRIQDRLKDSRKNSITFLGSGDFHHISSLLIGQFSIPLSVIIFDQHPDWDTLPPRNACGSWVNRVAAMKNVSKIILLGVSSEDISSFWIQTGNTALFKSDRMEMYPYCHKPSKVLLKDIPENISLKLNKGKFLKEIRWQELKDGNPAIFLSQVIKRLPVKQVYITIDKDCLKSDYSLTNWESGMLELGDLISMLELIKKELDVVGVDITGDYSQVRSRGKIKSICGYFDHPKDYTARALRADFITSINEKTNIGIVESLKG